MSEQKNGFTTVRREALAETPWLSLVRREVRRPDGTSHDWYSAERPDGGIVLVVALTAGGEVVLVRQWRPPLEEYVWELPAGIVESGETPEEAAERELLEETGFAPEALDRLAEGPVSAGMSNEYAHVFTARECSRVAEGGGVDSEQITVRLLPAGEAVETVLNGMRGDELYDVKLPGLLSLADSGK